MTDDLRAIGDACWTSFRFPDWQRAIGTSKVTPVADDIVYIATRGVVGNVTAVRTKEGLVVFDTGSLSTARQVYDTLRGWDSGPIHTVIFTHGHVDHVMGAFLFEEEAKKRNHPQVRFVGQRNMPARFARYTATAGFNTNINGRQFGVPDFQWPKQFRTPDLTYDERLVLKVGGVTFELNHGLGETDDHTWTWIADREVIVSGDFVIWAAPNSGNPQKVQRYTKPWAEAFRAMAAKKAAALVPGHGPAIFGADRVATLLADGAKFLDTMHDQVLALMNEGKTLDEIVQAVKIPTDLLTRPVPAADLRRSGVPDPQHLAPLWRLVGRRPGAPEARARRRPRRRTRQARRRRLETGRTREGTRRQRRPPPRRPPRRIRRPRRARERRRPPHPHRRQQAARRG